MFVPVFLAKNGEELSVNPQKSERLKAGYLMP